MLWYIRKIPLGVNTNYSYFTENRNSYLCAYNKIYRVLHQFHTKVHQLQQQRKIRETRQNQQQLQMSKLQQLLQH